MTGRLLVSFFYYKKLMVLFAKNFILLGLFAAVSFYLWNAPPAYGDEKFSGITEPVRDVTLSVSVEGTISTIFFKEGSHVKKGAPILVLDKKLEALEVERRKLIWESKVEVNSAEIKANTLKSLLDSTKKLFESTKSVSKEDLEKMELEYRLAVAEQQRLEIAEKRECVEYRMALQTLEKLRLKSPIHGIITKLYLDEGENCEPNQPLVHVVDTSVCLFVCSVEERIGRTLKKGQTVILEIRAGSGFKTKKGTIAFASPVVDPASGLMEVKVEFENRDGAVRPGVAGFMIR